MDVTQLKEASEGSDGRWFGDDVHGLPGVRLCVQSLVAPAVVRALGRRRRKAVARSYVEGRNGELNDFDHDTIEDEAVADVALVDWEGLTNDGEHLPFSQKMADELMKLPPFWRAVRACVNAATTEDNLAMEILAGNSRASSAEKQPAAPHKKSHQAGKTGSGTSVS